ncbi:MAG: alpha/beta hydrolase [Vicinamibacterales bacterium]
MRVIVVLLALFALDTAHATIPVRAVSQPIALRTQDGIALVATWYEPAARPAPAVILVHMLQRSRRDWDGFGARLASEGIGALAIDLRGHGESQGAAGDNLSVMLEDIKTARRYLASRFDVNHARIGLAGASAGANLAALEASVDAGTVSLALLSPSLDYRGLRIEAAVRKYGSRPLLLVVGDDDAYAMRSAKDLQKAGGGIRELLVLKNAGHGTNMLNAPEDLPQQLVQWFRRTLQ